MFPLFQKFKSSFVLFNYTTYFLSVPYCRTIKNLSMSKLEYETLIIVSFVQLSSIPNGICAYEISSRGKKFYRGKSTKILMKIKQTTHP